MRKKFFKKCLASTMALALVITGTNSIPALAAKKASVSLKKTSVSVTVGKNVKLSVVKKNVKKVKITTWTSKKKSIASVTKKGVVTGKKAGSTTVTCKISYLPVSSKKYITKTLTCKVRVIKKSAATPTASPVNYKGDDTSNIGEAREVSIAGGISDKMTVKDNGKMRTNLSSQELIKKEMGIGINLGNTMEATKAANEKDNFSNATDYETAWGAPVTTQKYIDAIHSYGFNTIRVPVAWTSMVKENDTTYTINEKMLGRVEEIVNYALNDGMYVIINDHFDYGWWGKFGACTEDANGNKIADETTRAEALKRYERYWEQISERFKGYSDHLIFESANEEFGNHINDYNLGFNTAVNGVTGNLTVAECYTLTNKLNQDFVDIVRKSGGNNENRHLLLAGYNTNIKSTLDDSYKMPKDTDANGTSKLSVSVHYYDPWGFCGDDAHGTYTEQDKKHTAETFDSLKKFTDAGYGVIIGECGVCNPKQVGVTTCLNDVITLAKERGLLPVLWETPGSYFDREKCIMLYKDIAEFFNNLTGSNGNTKDITARSDDPVVEITPVDVPADATPVWSWTGKWKKNDGSNIGLDGNKVASTDESKFIQKESCTDDSKIQFNSWGYQTFLQLDWSQFKKPCIKVTFEDSSEDATGDLMLSTTDKADGSSTDRQNYPNSSWAGKGFILPESMITSLKGSNPVLNLTFGNAPTVTSIAVYEMGQ